MNGAAGASEAIALGPWQVGGAAALVLVAGVISLALRLKLEGQLLLGMARATVQLLLVGWALEWIFAQTHLALTFAALGVMTLE
ncbi:MAG TPA: ABC transporter permease [Polyangiaceae bacterium LLY-WYZ-15_(1-7)]|nr:ABC transporter permease [Polyangiaceae bacterium LLY-WYZ-15_(1-7)]